jgi:hypothetical protein
VGAVRSRANLPGQRPAAPLPNLLPSNASIPHARSAMTGLMNMSEPQCGGFLPVGFGDRTPVDHYEIPRGWRRQRRQKLWRRRSTWTAHEFGPQRCAARDREFRDHPEEAAYRDALNSPALQRIRLSALGDSNASGTLKGRSPDGGLTARGRQDPGGSMRQGQFHVLRSPWPCRIDRSRLM